MLLLGALFGWGRPPAVKGAVRRANVEGFGVKSIASPLGHLFVIRVRRIAERLQKIRVPPDTANILRWSGPPAGGYNRISHFGLVRKHLLKQHLVFPAVTEIILVDHSILRMTQYVVEPSLSLSLSL